MAAILTGDTIKGLPIPLPTLDAYKSAFWTAGVMCLIAGLVPFAIRRIKPSLTPAPADTREPAKTGV
jgi:hypothetical protein